MVTPLNRTPKSVLTSMLASVGQGRIPCWLSGMVRPRMSVRISPHRVHFCRPSLSIGPD